MVLAAEESAKCKAAKEVIKSLTAQVCTCPLECATSPCTSYFLNWNVMAVDTFLACILYLYQIMYVTS